MPWARLLSEYGAICLKTCKITFQEAVTSQGESIRPQLAVFLHDKHPRTSDPLGKPREMMEPDSLGGRAFLVHRVGAMDHDAVVLGHGRRYRASRNSADSI